MHSCLPKQREKEQLVGCVVNCLGSHKFHFSIVHHFRVSFLLVRPKRGGEGMRTLLRVRPCTGGGGGEDVPCAACRGEAVSPC